MKGIYWFYHFPGQVYAYDIRLNEPMNERQVRAEIRRVWELDRLPRGTEIWRGSTLL